MRSFLMALFAAIFLAMLALTTRASMDRSILNVGSTLTTDPWFHATLADAYFGFAAFYVWVAYKETGIWRRLLWFVPVMTLGNIAMSIYVMIQLLQWDQRAGFESILLSKTAVKSSN